MNILANYSKSAARFSDVQLADLGDAFHQDSSAAKDGLPGGTPIFRSPEMHLQIGWDTKTDIWSFGVTVYEQSAYYFGKSVDIESSCSV